MISVSVHDEFTIGLRRTAQIIALAMINSGVTFTPAKSAEFFSRRTYSMVRVASTSTKMLTCGAVNALVTIAFAIALRTPLTGMRSSRSLLGAGVLKFLNTLAWVAAAVTSSRVTSPAKPVARTLVISTLRSLASLRIGGLAKTVSSFGTVAIKSVAGVVTAVAAACATGAAAIAAAAMFAPAPGRRRLAA